MQKILISTISLIMSVSLLVGAQVTEKEGDVIINRMLEVLRAQQDPFADPFAEREAEIAIINRMLEELKAEKKRLDEQANNEMNKRLAELRAGIDQTNGEYPKSSKVEIIGIGARLIDENGSCTIAELIPGGPAEKSQQLEPKDVILKVSKSDGTLADIGDMKLSEIVELIKGPKNSKVKLLIQPFKNPSTPKEVSIKRKPFHIYHQTHENKVLKKLIQVPSDTPSGKKLIVHIVKRGDTVKSIAKKYGSRVKWILNANQLTDPKKIKVGEKISVPQKKTYDQVIGKKTH
jgi:C-terminal processing protease CtpA/Prc